MKLELISLPICPFVQRSVITLLYKQIPHQVEYIDLNRPPAWFEELSPLGKVPLLKVDGQVLFESAVINEFLDEISPGSLLPQEPLARARCRAWSEVASSMLMSQYRLATAATEAAYDEARAAFLQQAAQVEKQLGEGPYFNGEAFGLVDAAYAPLLQRNRLLNARHVFFREEDFPRIRQWTEALLDMSVVQASAPEDLGRRLAEHIAASGGFGAGLFGG